MTFPGGIAAPSVLTLLLGVMPAFAGPITSNTALPVNEGEFILRAQMQYSSSTDDPSPLDRELTVWSAPSVLVYGLTEKLTLFGVAPYLEKRLDLTTPSGRRHTRGDSGLGDIRILARYTLGQWDEPGATRRVAPFLGLEVPTGTDDARDSLGRLPQPLQLGSGSWDPMIGTIFTWQTLQWELDFSASYTFPTEANDFKFGDAARLDGSYQYRLWPRELDGGVPGYLYAVGESHLLWQDTHEVFRSSDPNSGGTTWYLAPGIQFVAKRLIVEAAIQLPVIQRLNGAALRNDFKITAGLRINF